MGYKYAVKQDDIEKKAINVPTKISLDVMKPLLDKVAQPEDLNFRQIFDKLEAIFKRAKHLQDYIRQELLLIEYAIFVPATTARFQNESMCPHESSEKGDEVTLSTGIGVRIVRGNEEGEVLVKSDVVL